MMKRPDLAQTIQIAANVGIVAGIVFLAVEVRQNNESLAAQARYNRVTNAIDGFRTVATDGELAELRMRAARGEPLSQVEQYRLDAAFMSVWVSMAWVHGELPNNAPEKLMTRDVLRRTFTEEPNARRLWEARKSAFDPDFVAWVEENALPRDPAP